jgi:hypothetical protein
MPQITKGIQRLIQRSMNIDDLNSVIPYCLSEPKLKINYKQSMVHGQILHKSNMSSWGVPKCPKFIPKKYIRFTMTWMIEEHLKTTKQIWDVELHGTDSDESNPREIHHKQMQTPDLCSVNLCQSMWVQSWKRCCFLQAQSVPKKPNGSFLGKHTSNMVAQNEPIQYNY